ncbi:uncharacterized protein LOC111865183 [Cryptotermes secundus]|uniref:uncharacterized protein LOC111865183 n=1 Tax=Cryptotermes secundus TaxID=105785 RepID=UPI000CD7B013|nr:uncharacterized protein LOC111865183 [Cryptotermes secundus]
MFTARVWLIIVTCLLVNHLGNACLAAGLSLNGLEHHRNFEHRGRHRHGTQTADDSPSEPTTTASEVEDIGQNIENACCIRQEKYISIGLGASDEDIQLDVGNCQRSCRSLFWPIDLEFADLESSFFKSVPSVMLM